MHWVKLPEDDVKDRWVWKGGSLIKEEQFTEESGYGVNKSTQTHFQFLLPDSDSVAVPDAGLIVFPDPNLATD